MKTKYVEITECFEEFGSGFANGPQGDDAEILMQEFKNLGCRVYGVVTNRTGNEQDSEEDCDPNKWEFGAEIHVALPDVISPALIVTIASAKPDEISEEEPGLLRLWWD